MYVDKIELYGFKSFANRTEIPLARGVTAIVGPNGCGKSNISDAFRWALGEQNVRTLRGEKLEDVIFKGSGQSKPMGMAEVVLTVHNDDGRLPTEYTQVAIARRVYRSGDSEFLINKVGCRLKDIKDLFLGTGLVSGGYSMIERDMIDQVLSDKDDARRLLFEEAAGISRYKLRRRESQRKLEGVESDLIRIEDTLREIGRSVRSLSRQAGKARRYRRLQDELRRLDVSQAFDRWQELRRDALSSESARRRREGEVADLRSHAAVVEARRESERQAWLELGDRVDEAVRGFEEATRRVAQAEQEIQVLSTRNQSWVREERDLVRELERHRERLDEVRRELLERAPDGEAFAEQLEAARRESSAAGARRSEAEQALRAVRADLQAAQQTTLDLTTSHTTSKKELESIEARRRSAEARAAALARHLEGFSGRDAQIEESLSESATRESTATAKVERLSAERAERREATQRAQASREACRQGSNEAAHRRAQLASRLELLEEQRARHAGFDQAVRHLLDARHELPGLIGVVGEMVRLREGREREGRAVLGDTVPWILVRDEQTAIDLIHRLRAAGLGGVTFFPVESAGLDGGVAEDPVEEARIHELFATEGPGASFVHYLARRTRLCGSLQDALGRLHGAGRGGAARSELRWVTSDGEVVERGGTLVLAGGKPAEDEILRREQEIPLLQDALAEARAEIRRLEEEESLLTAEIESGERAVEEIDAARLEADADRQAAALECGRLRTERAMLREERERLEEERRQLDHEIAELAREDARLRSLVARSSQDSSGAQERFDRVRARAEAAEQEKDQRTREAAEQEMRVLRLEADLAASTARRSALDREGGERAASIAELEARREERAREFDLAEQRIQELDGILAAERQTRADRELEVGRRREAHLAAQSALSSFDEELRSSRARLDDATAAMHHDDVGRVQLESEAEQVRRRVLEEYGVDLADSDALRAAASGASAEADMDVDAEWTEEEVGLGADTAGVSPGEGADGPEAIAVVEPPSRHGAPLTPEARLQRIQDLRTRLQQMGSLNFLAEEEYAREKERLDFNEKHAQDLRTARLDLLEAIRQINERASALFDETFAAVQGHFHETYQRLFPGGEASLRLSGGDPLEGDIEISARPKGKKLESIRLLSSGERALTAIALLFAIYLAKPSPVCLLDEVDAPLDDANLDRFLELLRHFSERTQFILITHNKKTMAMAGRLFGVTMEEPGISKIVSVRLNEAVGELPFTAVREPLGTA